MTKSVSASLWVRIISILGAQRVSLVSATWRADRTENCRSAWAAQPWPFQRRVLVCSSSVAGNVVQSFTWSRHRLSKLANNGVPSSPGHSLTLKKQPSVNCCWAVHECMRCILVTLVHSPLVTLLSLHPVTFPYKSLSHVSFHFVYWV